MFPCATGDENYIGGAVETIEAHPADQREHPVRQDGARCFEHLVRTAGGGARGRQLGLPVLLHQGRPGSRDRERGEAGALRSIPAEERTLAENLLFNTPPANVPDDHPNAEHLRTAPAGLARADRASRRPPSTSSTSPRSRNISAGAPARREGAEGAICRSISGWPTTSSKARRTA